MTPTAVRSRRSGHDWLHLAVVSVVCVLGIVALLHGFGRDADAGIASILPVDEDRGGRFVALLSAAILFTIGYGLGRDRRLAWWLAVVVFATALLVQVAVVHHPIAAAIAAGTTVALLVDWRRYDVRPARASGGVLAIAIGTILCLSLLRVVAEAVGGGLPDPIAAVNGVATGLAAGFGIDDVSTRTTGSPATTATIGALLFVPARLLMMLSALVTLAPARPEPVSLIAEERARRLLDEHGEGALLPFQAGSDVSLHLAGNGEAVVAHARAGRVSIVLGDPVGPPDEWPAALGGFLRDTRRNGQMVAVYQATQATTPVLRAAGFSRVFRIGQEAIVDLETFDLTGSGRANLRHTITRFRRGGGTVEWYGQGMDPSALEVLGRRLADIDRTWRNRAGPQLGFTVGEFRPEDLAAIPVAVALAAPGQPIAFATFRPTGIDHGFVLELIRRTPDAIPGAVEACVGLAAERLRAGGVARLSLGLAPLHGLRTSGGPIEERLLRAGGTAVKAWYDIDGLAFFKGKFDPRWEPRYVAAVHRRDSIFVAVALLRLHLGKRGSLAGALSAVAGEARRSGARLIASKRRLPS